ncbi:hypothetical protein CSC94_22785 [Zhengella mangrovi]|uniref:Uncharacterized protein n=2 Tax=Zhengella mangrovi TaxID=1982044 RepID=A0A2G1QH32_9HYPH|nr:hypothetical protein CSC94_22785 [Zhengella mangrovi]
MERRRNPFACFLELLFAAVFLLSGVLAASAAHHPGSSERSAVHQPSLAALTGHGMQAGEALHGHEHAGCHDKGQKSHKTAQGGSCCLAPCFLDANMAFWSWSHARPAAIFHVFADLALASTAGMLPERPPKH